MTLLYPCQFTFLSFILLYFTLFSSVYFPFLYFTFLLLYSCQFILLYSCQFKETVLPSWVIKILCCLGSLCLPVSSPITPGSSLYLSLYLCYPWALLTCLFLPVVPGIPSFYLFLYLLFLVLPLSFYLSFHLFPLLPCRLCLFSTYFYLYNT